MESKELNNIDGIKQKSTTEWLLAYLEAEKKNKDYQ